MSDATILKEFEKRLESYRYAPSRFSAEVLGVEPHEGQRDWFRRSTSIENALVTGNRWGKSHAAAAKAIWKCAYRKGWSAEIAAKMDAANSPYHAINVSITADQSRLVWFKAHAMLQGSKASWLVKSVKMTPFPRIEFINGAVLEARSTGNNGERLLGNVYDHVNYDEAAYEKKFLYIRDNVLRMRVVDRAGTIDYTSTGNGRNDFGMYFLSGLPGPKKDPDLYSQTGSTLQNPNVDHARLAKNMLRMPERMRRQNILGEIVDAGGGFFSIDDLEAAVSDDLTRQLLIHKMDDEDDQLIEHCEVYAGREIEDGVNGIPWHSKYPAHRYVHGWDLANKKDYVVGITYDTSGDQLQMVEFERFRKRGWSYNYERIRERHHKYATGDVSSGSHAGRSKTYCDSTGVGDAAIDALKDIRAEGFLFSRPSKDEALAELQSALSLRQIVMPMIPVLFDEHKFYEREDEDLVQDTVMANAIAVHFGKRKKKIIIESF